MNNRLAYIKCLLLLLFLMFFSETAWAQPSGYSYYKDITINASQVPGTVTDFPVLISRTDTDLRDNVTSGSGYDIVFTNATGSQLLDFQLESYNSGTGALIAWVRVPTVSSSSNTTIRVYYGNSSVTTNQSSTGVWDTDYELKLGLSGNFDDGTANGNNATNNGSGNTTGKIGTARSLNGSSQYVRVPHDASLNMSANDQVTVSAWVWKDQQQSGWRAIVQKSDQSYNLQFNTGSNRPVFTIYDGGWNNAIAPSAISTGQWVYLVGTFDGSTIRLYVNGVQVQTETANSIASSTEDIGIGENVDATGRYMDGRIDEVRISSIPRSANWIATEYNNQNNPSTFHTFGTQLATDSNAPTSPQNVSASAISGGDIQISFSDVDEAGSGVASYSVKRSTTQGSGYAQVGTVTDNESSSYTFTDNTVSNGITYYYVVTAIDGASNEGQNSSEVSSTSDGTSPVIQSVEVNGSSLVANYSEALNVSSTPVTGDFTVTVNSFSRTVNLVQVSGSTVTLTLTPEVESGDVVLFNYTEGTNPIEDLAGNDAVNLSNQSVTNSTTSVLPTPPIDVTATAISGGYIEISFEDVDSPVGITSYSIKRASNQGGPYSSITTVVDNESASYSYTDLTPTEGSTYYYIVTSTDDNSEESANSDEVSATADATSPTLLAATVNAETLTLDYNELMDSNPVAAIGDFSVLVNGNSRTITNVSINGPRVILTLDPEVISGDNVVASYSSVSNPIRDVAGNNASSFSNQAVNNNSFSNVIYGPDPCPIVNGNEVAWACFSGISGGTSMTAAVGDLQLATVTAASGSQTTFAPNALQQWASGAFSGDQFNGPQVNPSGNGNNATSFDINIPAEVLSDAIVLSLNRLRPDNGGTSYTLEAFDGSNNKVTVNDWITGQGTDGGVCVNPVTLNYTNGNTTIEFQPTVSGNPSCGSSSTPVWFKITDSNVERIEIRKTALDPDNIHLGLALVGDFGDAPNTFGTNYNGSGTPPAFHLLSNTGTNPVYFGAGVDGNGNGNPNAQANGDDAGSDDEDGISVLADFNTAQTSYSTTLVCTDGGYVGGWIDFNQSGSFDANEYTSAICSTGSATMNWVGLNGLATGTTYARFRISSYASQVSNPVGAAFDGEVEDYQVTIIPPPLPDLEIVKTVNNSSPIEGDAVTFTLTVTNPGIYIASGIKVTDQLPTGLTFSGSTASQGTYNSSSGIWNIGTMPATGDSASVTLEITAIINSGTLGNTITNSASITSLNETDPELNNNTASAGVTVIPESADIEVEATSSNGSPIEGEYIDYSISVTNNGPKKATNLTILAQLPTGVSYQDSTVSTGSYNPVTGVWNIGELSVGFSASLTISVQIEDETVGNTIDLTAALQNMDQADPSSENDASTASVNVVVDDQVLSCGLPYVKFRNEVLLQGSALQVGALYRYNNVLKGVYANVEILTISDATILKIDSETDAGVSSPNEFAPFIRNNGGDSYVDFEISFYDSATGNPRFISFSATTSDVDGTGNLKDYVGYENLSSFVVETSTDLIQGSEGFYTTFISSNFNNTQPGNSNFTDYKVYAKYSNETSFRVRAGISSSSTEGSRIIALNFDPCEINSFSNPTTQVVSDVAVTKFVDDNSVSTGQQVTYTIQAVNKKASAVADVEITDQLPSGLTFVSANPLQGTYNNTTGIWDAGNLSGLQTATLEIVASVNNGTEGDLITNTASLTDLNGLDGVVSNNTSSVDILVNDPGSGLSCSEPPLFSFSNYMLERGVQNQVNSVYRYNNIGQGLDALVKIKAINNAVLDDLDAENLANDDANFSPLFTASQSGGYIDWEITFVATGTEIPVKKTFAMTALDIDGSNVGSGQSIRDYLGFAQNLSNTVQSGNNLNETSAGSFQIFESQTTTDGNGTFDINHMAYIQYNYSSVFEIRTGSYTTGGYTDDRLVDIDFTQCRNQDFTNPNVTTRDADIQIQKTVDQPNPLENEIVNFTITVTNNGPEDATELDVFESLPTGLSLIKATPSKGTYNQISKIWSLGSLSNNASATLLMEASVNSGITQDSLINKVYVLGLNQFDPVSANDTSEVVLKVSIEVEGTVFEDRTGNGYSEDTNFGDASGDQQALENVEVHLFKDGGDGVADGSDDTYESTVLTNNLGKYVFQIGEDADYWIVVDSKTGELSDGNTWAEQTYAPIGGLCEDGTGATNSRTVAGHCFGGRRGTVSDNISSTPIPSDLANAEHVAKVTVSGTGITTIDFGFSFNVVTQMNDNDQDLASGRHRQGSLRQFITNANAISGANTMRFIPAAPTTSSGSGGNWWKYGLLSNLPAITDALTTIDGTAYQLNAPKTTRDDNGGTVGTGGSVGIDNLSLNTTTRKELEIDLSDLGANAFVVNTSGAFVIRHIALYNNDTGIKVQNASSGLIENNLIGSRASGVDQGSGYRLGTGIIFDGGSGPTTLIQKNYIAFLDGSGIKSTVTNSSITVYNNEIHQAGLSDTQADGIEGLGSWIIDQNLVHFVGNSSSAGLDGGAGIELGASSGSSSSNSIRNNTIRNNKVSGINTYNNVTNTLIEENIINGNGTNYASSSTKRGAGVKLTTPGGLAQSGVRITRNSFYENEGISIDIVTSGSGEGDGVSPNDGLLQSSSTSPNRGIDYPVFSLSTLNGSTLHIEGYVGTSSTKLTGPFTVEVYKAANDGDNDGLIQVGGALTVAHGEGRDLLGTFTTNANGSFSTDITLSGSPSLVFNDRITAIAISSANNTSEFSGNQRVVPTGVSISGFVYHDTNHNAVKDGAESGMENVTIVLYNVAQNNCKSVLTDSNGSYQFTNVLNGTYNLIESFGQSVPTPDICTPAQVDPSGFISTTPNLRTVVVNNLPAVQNFGDYEGIKIEGSVFNDNGISGGTANDAIQNGGELGFSNQIVKVVTPSNTLIEQSAVAADGTYALYVPASAVSNGGTVKVVENTSTDKISTGGSAGTTSGTYNINTDETTFTISYGTVYTGVDFADVSVSRLLTDGERTTQPGAAVVFQHLFNSNTAGVVTFTIGSINNPVNPTWPVVLYEDLNCNGVIDSGEPIIQPTDNKLVTAGQNVCLLLKVTAPNGLNDGASSANTITATFSFANTSPVIQQILNRTDLVTVSTAEAGLVILKSVDKAQALPGATLVYSINYENLGDEPITQVEIIDVIPSFTTYQSSSCGTLPTGITNCTITSPAIGASGSLKWTFTGTLNPGQTGIVTFTVKIDD